MLKVIGTFSLLLSLVAPALAQQPPPCTRRYQVGVNNYAPFFSRDNKNRPQGLTHDLITEIQRRVGCVFVEKELFRPAAIEQMKGGRLDMVFLVIQGDEFGTNASFLSLYKVKREFLVRKEFFSKGRSVEGYVQDKKLSFGNIIGARSALTPAEEDGLLKSRRLVETVDFKTMFEMLDKGRIQAAMLTALVNTYYLQKYNMEDKFVRIIDEKSIADTGIYFSTRRVSGDERKKIEKALEDMREDGTINKIIMKYMSKQVLDEVTAE